MCGELVAIPRLYCPIAYNNAFGPLGGLNFVVQLPFGIAATDGVVIPIGSASSFIGRARLGNRMLMQVQVMLHAVFMLGVCAITRWFALGLRLTAFDKPIMVMMTVINLQKVLTFNGFTQRLGLDRGWVGVAIRVRVSERFAWLTFGPHFVTHRSLCLQP